MTPDVPDLLDAIRARDKDAQGSAFETLMAATDSPVDWANAAWARLVADLAHPDNRTRAIASQVLCNLAKSVPDEQTIGALPSLMTLTGDERFVTARHCLQSLWKIGVAGQRQRDAYREALAVRFASAADEKNGSLVRADIIESLRRVHEATSDQAIHDAAEQLIGAEPDDRYRRKYTKLWRAGGGT